MEQTGESTNGLNVVPGSVVSVRDATWVVTSATATPSGTLVKVQGLSELVRDTEAAFYSDLDTIEVIDPREATVVADESPRYRQTRLYLETVLRTTPVPSISDELTVSTRILADPLQYQRRAVAKALDPSLIRPRILLADAVGLGKTLEIGMILAELVARGRGENILIVTPRHVLEQMQHEMWTRFALPFVRLDSVGLQRIRQTIPATRNPFTYFKRAIISIDTLKTPRYRAHLEKRRWDAVVIDESHNLTNTGTLNNELARVLAPRTDALILASATPHNGKEESFAELLRLLDPTVVSPQGEIDYEAAKKLVIRRHRYSPEVASEVGADWAERPEPQNRLIAASPAEDAIATELAETWLHNPHGSPGTNRLFGWTLAKAFLSSPAALAETIRERLRPSKNASATEVTALKRLLELTDEAMEKSSSKFEALVDHLKAIGVGPRNDTRVVVFAERLATLHHLQQDVQAALKLKPKHIGLLHGGLSDVEQLETVEEFKRGTSDLKVLITGDVASEGVNLHAQCHNLVHYDIPWSLIRIEQRNGRIDRYGQTKPPQITTLLLEPSNEKFSGDVRIFTRLVQKEHEAHRAFDDVGVLMGKYSAEAEERAVRDALVQQQDLETAVPDKPDLGNDPVAALLVGMSITDSLLSETRAEPAAEANAETDSLTPVVVATEPGLYATDLQYLDEALDEAFNDPQRAVDWDTDDRYHVATLAPPRDLQRRLRFLPRDYVRERKVLQQLRLATSKQAGEKSLRDARSDEDTNWPAAHYLGPLHPVLDWASDRALANMSRNEVPAVRGDVPAISYLMLGTITNKRGQILNRTFMGVTGGLVQPVQNLSEYFADIGLTADTANPGAVNTEPLQAEMAAAVDAAAQHLSWVRHSLSADAEDRLEAWIQRAQRWTSESDTLIQRTTVQQRAGRVREELDLAEELRPNQELVRPLLAVMPREEGV
ncbi:MAG: DEAD/DEAH box helicase [Yaniella sp.]|uniref:helicase-related protein n=1 Tax=Yaniella sp. TaxID=2773929 RepID=UPI0026496AED|nr:helicase-related protein [Yaniella sp.]MDN5730299.1 DEAD/DEAH box helicase [Yaniella sp.]MDN5814223.1 DEAD/DEAH box helicase [Yaniella sp.]MDN5817137.1 DEAD/DEAH box helicase [Yaniella sp.]MDN5837569.1 DEAD/DEAH box helicase [Yaniella sp.]MDN5888728.1 DEAD/DEAH box helicase [Yaniella sp.]